MEEQVIQWLREGRDDAQDIVDLPWNVKKIEEHFYIAEYPKMPFVLNILFSEEFVHLMVPFGLETTALPLAERLKIYHAMLVLNDKINLLKFTLSGINDEIILRVDLDRKTLGKAEFNDALTALLIGINELVRALKVEEDFAQAVFERIVLMLIDRIQRGATRDDLIKFLVVKVGMSKEEAEKFIDEILRSQGISKKKGIDIGYI
ncbi:hypothetical protein [Thermococcus barophilus]|uniref:Uncharacterized protein n=1 Tax=Thermococcus barophilus TaxID=55802 RepID=A0A0S1XE62_THEBA|nr:hypothetical protein [Thermococcus barophilus]ALM76070.1 hypothetical protein TBCH5v1_2170 [Thermococcus barophilus]